MNKIRKRSVGKREPTIHGLSCVQETRCWEQPTELGPRLPRTGFTMKRVSDIGFTKSPNLKEKGREKKTVTHRRSIGGGRRSNEGLQAAGHAVPVAAWSATGEPERSGGDDKANNDHQHTAAQLSSSSGDHRYQL